MFFWPWIPMHHLSIDFIVKLIYELWRSLCLIRYTIMSYYTNNQTLCKIFCSLSFYKLWPCYCNTIQIHAHCCNSLNTCGKHFRSPHLTLTIQTIVFFNKYHKNNLCLASRKTYYSRNLYISKFAFQTIQSRNF